MKPCELQILLSRAVEKMGSNNYWSLPPEARVVTGIPKWDSQLHHALVEFGVEVKLDKNHVMEDYCVVDEKKFTMFLLRYSA